MAKSVINNDRQQRLEIVKLEERLEIVQLSAVAAASFRCDGTEQSQVLATMDELCEPSF